MRVHHCFKLFYKPITASSQEIYYVTYDDYNYHFQLTEHDVHTEHASSTW